MAEPVDAHLDMTRDARGIEVRAFVAAAPARPLRWQLVSRSRNSGGTSEVSQSGTTDGSSDEAISVTIVSPDSRGTVALTVFDGTTEVASDGVDLAERTIGPPTAPHPETKTGDNAAE